MNHFFIGRKRADCIVMWRMKPSPSLSDANTNPVDDFLKLFDAAELWIQCFAQDFMRKWWVA